MRLKPTIFLKHFALKWKRIWTEMKWRVYVLLTSPKYCCSLHFENTKGRGINFLQILPKWRKMARSGCNMPKSQETAWKCQFEMEATHLLIWGRAFAKPAFDSCRVLYPPSVTAIAGAPQSPALSPYRLRNSITQFTWSLVLFDCGVFFAWSMCSTPGF